MKLLTNNNPLFDDEFLSALDRNNQRELYVKIIALTLDEDPVDEIQGRVTAGSLSIDGSSKVRRSCSLTLVSEKLNLNEYLWGLNTKVIVYIGMKNMIDTKRYDDIIWFKQGTFVLTNFNISIQNAASTITLQGKDKMCFLNGDVGGNLTALSYKFDTVEVVNSYNSIYKEKLTLERIIREAVHTFGNEPYHNIIINDLDTYGLELLTYRGSTPMYLLLSCDDDTSITGMVVNEDQIFPSASIVQEDKSTTVYTNNSLKNLITNNFKFRTLNELNMGQIPHLDWDRVTLANGKEYNLIKIEPGMTCGYRITDMIYPKDLIVQANGTLTSMLDNIVTMLGNFEYFYNLDGQFIFQKKRTYVNTSWNNLINNGEEQWADNAAYTASHIYSLYDSHLVSSYSNAPALNNVKNDFSIWGTKPGIAGGEVPVHLRYAIDRKPIYYTSYDGVTYTTRTEEEVERDKESFDLNIRGGYQKEPSRFGLSEDWWEVRDWAKAWEYSGLPVPKQTLGTYCPIRATLTTNKNENGSAVPGVGVYYQSEYSYMSAEDRHAHGLDNMRSATDDIVFDGEGKYFTAHGGCAHTYTQWLQYFNEGGSYEGGYAYFYKPQIPADSTEVDIQHQGGLLLSENIKYELDWRELIYQMAVDSNKNGSKDDFLAVLKQKNSFFFPTGYTGYEQYYIDMIGFWRELYNPDYECSYDVQYLTKSDFEEKVRQGGYYYDAPIYEQCKTNDIFYDNITYYTKSGNNYIMAIVAEYEFNRNKTAYYYIKDTEIKPITVTPNSKSNTEYYYKQGNWTTGVLGRDINIEDFPSYYRKVTTRKTSRLFKMEPYNQGVQYNIKQEKKYEAVSITASEYNSAPWLYYRNKNGSQICCTEMNYPPDSITITGYLDANGNVLSQYKVTDSHSSIITPACQRGEIWYYTFDEITYEPCATLSVDYSSDQHYYTVSPIKEFNSKDDPRPYWKSDLVESPETLIFWFDFLDTDGELSNYAVYNIGDRPKAVNDKDVKAIYFRETPGVIFIDNWDTDRVMSGYTYAQIPHYMHHLFSISSQGKSAKDVLDDYLYKYSYCTENVTISTLPIYHLEPNTRILLRDDNSHVNGEYIVNKLSVPLTPDGKMTINAVKAVDRLY